jgi:hypothetical protein
MPRFFTYKKILRTKINVMPAKKTGGKRKLNAYM